MSNHLTPVEVLTRYAVDVPALTDAWTFVMERLEFVGDTPRIKIEPLFDEDEDGVETHFFSVVVEGIHNEVEVEITTDGVTS